MAEGPQTGGIYKNLVESLRAHAAGMVVFELIYHSLVNAVSNKKVSKLVDFIEERRALQN